MATQPPLPPPPLPPLPLELILNTELSLIPADDSKPAQTLSTVLASVGHQAVVVGVLGDNNDATVHFANRLMGRHVFSPSTTHRNSSIDVRMFYDQERKMIVLLGLGTPTMPTEDDISSRASIHAASLASQCDHMKMQLLLYTSSHVLFVVHDHARVSTAQTKLFRSLSSAKHHLLHLLKTKSKAASSSSSLSPYAPGRSVPFAAFVFPAPPEALSRTSKARSSIMTFCKAMEGRVHALVKPLRGGVVATVRAKDAAAQSTKERRLFVMDPTHCVVAVTRKAATSECSLMERMTAVMDDMDLLAGVDMKQLLKPLDDEDNIGMPHAIQFVAKCVDVLLQEAMGKDPAVHLLTVAHWLRQFNSLVQIVVLDNAVFQTTPSSTEAAIAAADDASPDFKDTPMSLVGAIDMFGTLADDMSARESAAAIKRYQLEKPEKINTRVHHHRVQRTIHEYKRCVGPRNPMAHKYIQTIEEACRSIWHQGRRLCDAISISNRPCGLLYHEDNSVVQHNSGFYLTAACSCGHSINRLADAFSTDTNRRELWVFPCCERFQLFEMPSTISPLPMVRLGDFAAYDPFQGFAGVFHGFVSKFTSLSPWFRASAASAADAPTAQQQTSKKTRSGRKQPKPSQAPPSSSPSDAPNELMAYAGLEYECCAGHRFFFHTPVNQAPSPLESHREETVWPGCDMAIYVQCFQCSVLAKPEKETTEYAQLRRVYASIPPGQTAVELNLSIKTEDQAHEVFTLHDVALADDSLVCYSLPYVFSSGGVAYRHGDALKLHSRVLVVNVSGREK
ncbi:Aste57867_20634 [Aphanomyces stellatus]|uniref:Nonsense-mediated mRNA decay factor SMG8 n=1 Tax=Aphanomyces stellatus TaxID=120398 RepID=A0A485LHF4_9STRA|nr:hypothetical protein As57867_020566 [Aphanomyces stellatus]VFT97314.1 Aste57867_20634 [Aphanomyces stellatus]